MSWMITTVEAFTVPFDFDRLVELAAQTEEIVSDAIHKNYIGRNYLGKFLTKLVSIDHYGEPFMNTFDATVTMTVSFTADCLKLIPGKIIYNPVIQKIGYGSTNNAYCGVVPLPIQGSSIKILYSDEYSDILVGSMFPTILSEVSHNPYSTDITIMGKVLLPDINVTFYKHDPSRTEPTMPLDVLDAPQGAKDNFDKARALYDFEDPAGVTVMSKFSSNNNDSIYMLRGPFGPILEIKPGTTVNGQDYESIKSSVTIVNMYDIETGTVDATNALLAMFRDALINPEDSGKIKPYLSLVRTKLRQRKRNGARQQRSVKE